MAEKKEKTEYRLLGPRFYVTVKGKKRVFTRGELVPLTATQAVAFKDQFEPKGAAEERDALVKEAKAKADADKKVADKATDRRAQDLEDAKKVEADKATAKAEAANPNANAPTPDAAKAAEGNK